MSNHADDWGQYLEAAVFATNSSTQSSTKFSPFELMFNRLPRFPLQAEKQSTHSNHDKVVDAIVTPDEEDFMQHVIQEKQSIFKSAEEKIKQSQKRQQEQYKKKRGVIDVVMDVGDFVLRRNMKQKTRKGSKSEDRWLGPYKIVEVLKTTCRLQNKAGVLLKTGINVTQLKKYFPADQDPRSEAKCISSFENLPADTAKPPKKYLKTGTGLCTSCS